jgi:hypothetical protein
MKKAIVALSAILLAVGMASTAMAQSSDNEGSDVNVTVSSVVEVDISPNRLDYVGNSPGSFNDTSNRDYQGIEIENLGSENITNIWMGASTVFDRPFGTGQATNYDAGNFMQIRPVSGVEGVVAPDDGGDSADAQSGFHYLNRKEYNESNTLSYINLPDSGEWRYGRFREGDEEFFWAASLSDGTDSFAENLCDGEASEEMRVSWNSHDRGNLGSVDFTDSSNYVSYSPTPTGDYGKMDNVELRTDHGNRTYTVLSWCGSDIGSGDSYTNSTFTIRTRYNVDAGNYDQADQPTISTMADDAGSTPSKLMNSSTSQEYKELQPGEHFTVQTGISVPYGVSQGEVTEGQMTVYVNNAN